VTRVIDAPARELFEAWLDPEALAHFMKPADGMRTEVERADAREGGGFSLTMYAGEKAIPIHGEYRAIERYTKLAFTWRSHGTVEGSLVTLSFEEIEGGTKLTLHHTGFPSEEMRDSHEEGWTAILVELGRFAADRERSSP
jgi:uncharacterized protein YndB with AHSA1/START domain